MFMFQMFLYEYGLLLCVPFSDKTKKNIHGIVYEKLGSLQIVENSGDGASFTHAGIVV